MYNYNRVAGRWSRGTFDGRWENVGVLAAESHRLGRDMINPHTNAGSFRIADGMRYPREWYGEENGGFVAGRS